MGKALEDGQSVGIDPDAVATASQRIAASADTMNRLHIATSAMLEDSGSGHVGSSAHALSDLSRRWAVTGRRHTERIDILGRGVGQAGMELTDTERHNWQQINGVAGS